MKGNKRMSDEIKEITKEMKRVRDQIRVFVITVGGMASKIEGAYTQLIELSERTACLEMPAVEEKPAPPEKSSIDPASARICHNSGSNGLCTVCDHALQHEWNLSCGTVGCANCVSPYLKLPNASNELKTCEADQEEPEPVRKSRKILDDGLFSDTEHESLKPIRVGNHPPLNLEPMFQCPRYSRDIPSCNGCPHKEKHPHHASCDAKCSHTGAKCIHVVDCDTIDHIQV